MCVGEQYRNSIYAYALRTVICACKVSADIVVSRDNWSGVKSGPPGPIFACEIWTVLAKSGPGIQKPAAVGE